MARTALPDGFIYHSGSPPPPSPPPPAGTTADMLLRRADGTYEIYDLGGNTILAAYSLGQVGPQQLVGLGGFQVGDTADVMLESSHSGASSFTLEITGTALIGPVGYDQ